MEKDFISIGAGLNLEGFFKGRKGYPIGTIREYNGIKFQKVSEGEWKPVKGGSKGKGGIERLIDIVGGSFEAREMDKRLFNGEHLNNSLDRVKGHLQALSDAINGGNDTNIQNTYYSSLKGIKTTLNDAVDYTYSKAKGSANDTAKKFFTNAYTNLASIQDKVVSALENMKGEIDKIAEENRKPSSIKWKKPLNEDNFTGYPDWDEMGDIDTPEQAVAEIKAIMKEKGYKTFSQFYWDNDNQILQDYLNSDLDLDDKRYIASALGLSGMLSTQTSGFEFTEKDKEFSMYSEQLGDDDYSVILCYDAWKVPKEIQDMGRNVNGAFVVHSNELEPETFEKRVHGKVPTNGLLWSFDVSNWSGTGGYWTKDKDAKKNMMDYCGLEEFKDGNLVIE